MKNSAKVKYATLLLLVIFICLSCSSDNKEVGNFRQEAFEIADYGIFDLGVADINSDDRLDIFTVNHSGQQSLMLNNGPDGFTDVYTLWEMDQDRHFPGLSISPDEPPAELPGIYINWVGPDVFVRSRHTEKKEAVHGRIEVFTPIEILKKQNFDVNVKVTDQRTSPEVVHSVIEFSCQGDGYFSFRPYNHALPFQFHFDGDIAAENIHIGRRLITPDTRDFVFQLRDRHGMAWVDYNNDDRMDVFITRGGENGTMSQLPMPFWDELLLGTPTCMEDIGTVVGLSKNGCPGRQTAWIDYDGDNRLEIYVVCGRSDGSHANMLFRQTSDGHFQDVAARVGLDIPSNGSFVWLDVDLDNDMDLFWSDADGFFLYKNDAGKFSPIQLESQNRKSLQCKLTVADYDNDGDLDIFSAMPRGNVLFVNTKGVLSAVMPLSIGLPDKSATANWVDYDNDGFLDMHTAPDGGLYIQKQKGKFIFSSQLNTRKSKFFPYRPASARAAWFDVDNNGSRDLLLAIQWKTKKNIFAKWLAKAMGSDRRFGGLGYFWEVDFFDNQNVDNHWLQVQLEGPPGNRQAIGARVTLQTADTQQIQQVGISDGSHYSQGHYRLYFGLGRKTEPFSLQVDWPDGESTEIVRPLTDRLLTISYPPK